MKVFQARIKSLKVDWIYFILILGCALRHVGF